MLSFAYEIDPTLAATLAHSEEVDDEVESVTSSLDPDNPCNYDATTKGKRGTQTYEPMPKKKSVQKKYHHLVMLNSLTLRRKLPQLI